MTKKIRIALTALGCKVNQEEGAAILSLFPSEKFQPVPFTEEADVYIMNTCTVTHLADRKSRQLLRRTAREHPGAFIVAMGCYSQMHPTEAAALPGVDLVLGTNNRRRLPELLDKLMQARQDGFCDTMVVVEDANSATTYTDIPVHTSPQQRVRAYLKIEDGCNNYCAYCIIPYARGPVRSKPLAEIISQAQELIAAGYQEIVLTGIHTGAYGSDLPERPTLAQVAKVLAELPGLRRLRLGSVEPIEISDDLLAVMASHTNICPQLHIPLQAGDDATLARMGRHYTTAEYSAIVDAIRQQLPDAAITTDLMVGFPGETTEEFANSLAFAKKIGFLKIHVFPYSIRPGTKAATMPEQVDASEKSRRVKAMQQVADAGREHFAVAHIGQELEVLVEQQETIDGKPFWVGHTPSFLPVAIPSDGKDWKGKFISVIGKKWRGDWLFAILRS